MVRLKDPDGDGVVYLSGERAERYTAEANRLSQMCRHPEVRLCRRGASIVHQCTVCGRQDGTPVKKLPEHAELPGFDMGLSDLFSSQKEAARLDLERRFWAEEKASEAEREHVAEPMALEYAQYLRTPEWQSIRQRVLKRAGGLCEGCLIAKATEVHHKDYRHVRGELLFDLVAVCRDCHRKAHPGKHEFDFLYEDFSPCSSCRWDNGGIYCLKFDVETYKAFEPGGACYPPGAAHEGLK